METTGCGADSLIGFFPAAVRRDRRKQWRQSTVRTKALATDILTGLDRTD
jgi:hypothetical protein